MSVFPYNNDEDNISKDYNGSPLNLDEATELAEKILDWHFNKNTSDWSQSGDGHMLEVSRLAFGLMGISSDPNFLCWIQIIGKDIIKRCDIIVEVHEMYKDIDITKTNRTNFLYNLLKKLKIIKDTT